MACVASLANPAASFSARLPELCDSINRKLGGPVRPLRRTTTAAAASRAPGKPRQQRPGAATRRPAAPVPNPQKALQRALSTDRQHRRGVSRGPGSAIALMRSATSTSLPGIKREGSEPVALQSLSREELNRQLRLPPVRSGGDGGGGSGSGSSSGASSGLRPQDAKANKRAMVDAELKDAISAVRKPNRVVVSKAMAEADERRAVTSTSLSAKSKSESASAAGTRRHAG